MEALNDSDSDNGQQDRIDLGLADNDEQRMPSVISGMFLRSPGYPESDSRLGLTDDVIIEPQPRPNKEQRIEIPDWEIAVIVVCTVVATAALLGALFYWMQRRRKKGKNNADLPTALHATAIQQLSTANSNVDSHKSNGIAPVFTVNGAIRSAGEEFSDAMTEYGSIAESFPPSPTLSFRSVIDGPGFNRSRAGTGTSFGTVASFASDRTSRSRASTVASFTTCYENDVS